MSDDTTNPKPLNPKVWPAIVAKYINGNPKRLEGLSEIFKSLNEETRNEVALQVLAQDPNADINSISSSNSSNSFPERFKLHSAAEALLPQPRTVWDVENMLSKGMLAVAVGDPASKKTYSLLDLCICVSLGTPWIGYPTKQGPVLVIDEESGERRLNQRLGDIMRAHSADENTPLYFVTLAGFNLRNEEDLEMLEKLIKETQSEMVLIDSMVDVMPGADENSVKDMQPLFTGLRGVIERTQTTIVMIHHFNKNGRYRGSSALKGAVDVLMTVKSENGKDIVNFEMEKNRDGEPIKFSAQAHFEKDRFWLTEIAAKNSPTISPTQRKVLEYFSKNGPCSNAGLGKELGIKKAINDLIHSGLLIRTDGGPGGKIAIYELTDAGKGLLLEEEQ